ncbi:MAG: polysaccharide deacetylase family protein [Treponema sp.]|nr:polysaccharide deacetylase family protein [Candidatus Treponema equi]
MKNRDLLKFLLGTVILVSATSAFAKVTFDDIDLASDDKLLFTEEHKLPGVPDYKSLYAVKLGESKTVDVPKLLTCFPERLELLNEGKVLQVRNKDGSFRYATDSGKLSSVEKNTTGKKYARTYPASVSSDGKWYCYVEPVKNASGKLVLVNAKTNLKKILVETVDLDHSEIRVKWSPDGKIVLYENNNCVYFATPEAIFKNLQVNESYRKIGEGSIDNVQWTQDKKVIYVKDDIIYKVDQNELYTRGLYSSLVGSGEIIGRLPGSFNSATDRFWCSAKGTKIAVVSKGNLFSLYSIPLDERFGYVKIDMIYTLTEISGSSLSHRVFWNGEKQPILWIDSLDYTTNQRTSTLYSIEEDMHFLLQAKNSIQPVLSPDMKKFAYTDNGVLRIFDIPSLSEISSYSEDTVVSATWSGKTSLFIGGKNTVSGFNYVTREINLVTLSSVVKGNWYSGLVIAKSADGKNAYAYDFENSQWKESKLEAELKSNDRNGSFRVFKGKSRNHEYENSILVRYLSGNAVTYSVRPEVLKDYGKPVRVAFAFDAMDNSEGLGHIIHTLAEYGIKGTFFMNGEFVRRYPQKTMLIANSGNDCASLFYTTADLVENKYVIDNNYIARGLARNEDEFFSVTKKELSLMWHAPNYHETQEIVEGGNAAGYQYIYAYNLYNDRTTYERSMEKGEPYKSAGQLIDCIVDDLRDGMVIPVTVGKTAGTRSDYLYEKLDLLIAAILDNGYEITEIRNLK